MKYALAAALVLVGLVAPSKASADSIVDVTISNITFNGNNSCGPSGTALCTVTISAGFQWDNTTTSYVAGSFSSTVSGALGTSFSLTQAPVIVPFINFPLLDIGVGDAQNDGIQLQLSTSAGQLSAGTYQIVGQFVAFPPSPQTAGAILQCNAFVTDQCNNVDYPLINVGGQLRPGANPSGGQITVTSATPVAEPSSLLLLGTGLLSLIGVSVRRRLLA